MVGSLVPGKQETKSKFKARQDQCNLQWIGLRKQSLLQQGCASHLQLLKQDEILNGKKCFQLVWQLLRRNISAFIPICRNMCAQWYLQMMRTFKASAVVLCLDTIPTDAVLEGCPSQRGSFLTAVLQSLGDGGFLFFFVMNSQKHVQTSCFGVLCGGWFSSSPLQALALQVECRFIHWIRVLSSNFHPPKKVIATAELQSEQLVSFSHEYSRIFLFCLPKEAAPFGEAVRKGSVCLPVWGNWFPPCPSCLWSLV